VSGGAIVGAASLGAAYQTLQTNSAGTNVLWGAVNLGQAAAITGLMPLGNLTPGSNGQFLSTVGGAATWVASPALSVTGNGLVVVSGGVIQSAAIVGTSGQILLSGSTNVQWETMSGDGSINSSGVLSVVSIHGATVPAAGALTIGNVLQVSGSSALTYGPLAASGISPGTAGQLLITNATPATAWVSVSGDSTISAAGAMVNLAIHGATVPAAGALTTGNVLQVSGASALSYGSLNLALAATVGASVLPAANQAAQTMGGDASGTTAACVVAQAQSGAITFASGSGLIGFAAADTGPGLSQTIAASAGVTPVNLTITPQPPNAGASTVGTGTPGSCVVALAAPVSTGAETALLVTRAGVGCARLGALNVSYDALWFGNAALAPSATNYAFLSAVAGAYTSINDTAQLLFSISNTEIAVVTSFGLETISGYNIGLGGGSIGGGAGVMAIANATTQPSSAPSGGIVLSANGGALNVYDSVGNNALISGSAVTFSAATTIATATLSGSTGAATITLKGGGNSGSANAGAVQVAGGAASGSVGAGGAASLLGGAGGSSGASAGGAITITGGASSGSSGVGGAVTITGGGSTNGAAGAILIQSGSGSGSTNATTTLSTGRGTTYGALGVVSSGNTPGVLTFLGGAIGTTQSVGGGGKSTLNVATGSFLFAPASWNGITVQVVLCV
jgi:hypothetical protein